MHAPLYRANALFTCAASVLAVMCVLATLTDYYHVSHPRVSVEYLGLEGLQREYGSDRAYIRLKIDADLRSVFTWNTKQVFAYAKTQFETDRNQRNEMVVWSSIVTDKKDAWLRLPSVSQQYPYVFSDQGYGLRGKAFNVTLVWDVQPFVGRIYSGAKSFGPWTISEDYVTLERSKR